MYPKRGRKILITEKTKLSGKNSKNTEQKINQQKLGKGKRNNSVKINISIISKVRNLIRESIII